MHPQEVAAALREALKHTSTLDKVSRGDQLQIVCKAIAAACEQGMKLGLDMPTALQTLIWVHDEILIKASDLPSAIGAVSDVIEAGGKLE